MSILGLTLSHSTFLGIAAVLAVFILKIPQLGTLQIGQALEWVFYILLPNFGYGNGLQDLYVNYEYRKQCSEVSTLPIAEFCRFVDLLNGSNPCCPGQYK